MTTRIYNHNPICHNFTNKLPETIEVNLNYVNVITQVLMIIVIVDRFIVNLHRVP